MYNRNCLRFFRCVQVETASSGFASPSGGKLYIAARNHIRMADDCIFCGIAAGSIPAKKVYEDSETLAFLDISPRNPGHTLVIPKVHAESIFEISEEDLRSTISVVKKVSIAVREGTRADGISITSSNGKSAGQMVPHLHFHVIPRFATEGPPSLESILSPKKLDEKSMEKVAEGIKENLGIVAGQEATPRKKERGAPVSKEGPAPKREEEDEFEDLDNIEFDL